MKIAFISTDMDIWALGMRSVSAVLKEAGHITQIIFLPTSKRVYSEKILDDLIALVRDVDVIGISCLARGSQKAVQVINALRHLKKLIVWGGVHASLTPVQCADWADMVCRGEGEDMMLELMEKLKEGECWKDIRNIVYKEGGVLITNPVRPPISDLDSLPLPDFSFEAEYILESDQIRQVHNYPGLKDIYFNCSRGCTFYCTYCCNEKIKNIYADQKHYVRRMSVARLIQHVQKLRLIFPDASSIYFLDEDFAARPMDELIQFSESYPQEVGLPFECLAHPARITQQKMELLVNAGLWRINMGVESGSERTRQEVYNRYVSNKAIKRAAEIISNYPRVVPYYFFIIGNPYEDKSDLITTARFVSELPNGCHIIIYNLVFFPGSSLYQRAIQDNLITSGEESGYDLDFLGGYHYKDYEWKTKNFYLNGLLFLLGGEASRHLLGILPRFMLDSLLKPPVIEFNQSHTVFIRAAISITFAINSLRHQMAKYLKKVINDRTMIYNLRYSLSKALKKKISLGT